MTIGPIYLLLKNCPKLTHLSLTGISSFLRREITQYCRDPPPDFNEHQKSLFCVFSGHGVNQLRNYLNQVIEERTFQGDIHTIFNERRRRFLNGDFDMDDEEMNIWERRRIAGPGAGDPAVAVAGTRGMGAITGTGTVITPDLTHPDMAEINREIFRELNEGNMGPEEMREHFQRLIRNHHQQRLFEHQIRQNLRMAGFDGTQLQQQRQQQEQQQQEQPQQATNPQNAPQIEQPAVFPNDNTNNSNINNNTAITNNLPAPINEDEDIEMEAVDLFPRNT